MSRLASVHRKWSLMDFRKNRVEVYLKFAVLWRFFFKVFQLWNIEYMLGCTWAMAHNKKIYTQHSYFIVKYIVVLVLYYRHRLMRPWSRWEALCHTSSAAFLKPNSHYAKRPLLVSSRACVAFCAFWSTFFCVTTSLFAFISLCVRAAVSAPSSWLLSRQCCLSP